MNSLVSQHDFPIMLHVDLFIVVIHYGRLKERQGKFKGERFNANSYEIYIVE